jgi:hypothetical protein
MGQTCLLYNLAHFVDGSLVDYSHGGDGGALEVYMKTNYSDRQNPRWTSSVSNFQAAGSYFINDL